MINLELDDKSVMVVLSTNGKGDVVLRMKYTNPALKDKEIVVELDSVEQLALKSALDLASIVGMPETYTK